MYIAGISIVARCYIVHTSLRLLSLPLQIFISAYIKCLCASVSTSYSSIIEPEKRIFYVEVYTRLHLMHLHASVRVMVAHAYR